MTEQQKLLDPKQTIVLDKEWPVEFLLDKDTLDVFVKFDTFESKIDKVKMNELKPMLAKIKKLKVDVKKSMVTNTWWDMGDRVFLYWPTGTGKTHSVLAWLNGNKIPHDVVTVSDWFEDIDFLTHIVPSAKGIQYKEKKILDLFRRAEKWERIGILIDEVNRWSKSFMNLLLKMVDSVSDFYEVNNFVADEVIKVPRENIIRFCTANLGGWYSGTNEIDEALLNRFNKVEFVGYNEQFEDQLLNAFAEHKPWAQQIVKYIRDLFKDNAIKRPISSRWLKTWAEDFVNTSRSKEDVFGAFERTVMYSLVGIDSYWFPSEDDVGVLAAKFMDLWFIGKWQKTAKKEWDPVPTEDAPFPF